MTKEYNMWLSVQKQIDEAHAKILDGFFMLKEITTDVKKAKDSGYLYKTFVKDRTGKYNYKRKTFSHFVNKTRNRQK
jgi:hypothetical protein